MGYRGLFGAFVTTGAKGIAIQKTYGALTGLSTELMEEYQRNLTPGYQTNSQLVALSKAVEGKFKMVDLSTVLPYDFVNRPFRALLNAIDRKEINQENTFDFLFGLAFGEKGPMRELFDPFVSTPIGNEAFNAVLTGETKSGKQIWGELNTPEEKWDKSVAYLAQTLEPGALTSMRQAYSALTGTEYKGRVYDMKDVLMGLFTGVKPYEVDLNKNINFLVNDYKNIRSKAFDGSKMYKKTTYGSTITEEFIDIQRNIWLEQKRIYDAFMTAQKFGVTRTTISNELRSRQTSYMDIMKIMSGKMDPITYSKPRMEEKVKELRENDRINGFSNKREINQDAFYPRGELDYILRQLNSQRLDEPFMFDQMQAPTIPTDQFPPKTTVEEVPENNNQTKLPLEPLPPQPAVRVASNVNASPPFASLPKNDQFKLLFPNG